MIDLHTHTLLSDGVLVPSELVRRAEVHGYEAIAITDHVDASNIERVIGDITKYTEGLDPDDPIRVIPGVEITHVRPDRIGEMTKLARSLGAKIVICHGETVAEPVARGTNRAAIEAGVDILAHPGLITEEACRLAAERGVYLEITSRAGHSITNGHVASMAALCGARMVLNSDAHAPGDLISDEYAMVVAHGASIDENLYGEMKDNARNIIEKLT